MSGAGRALVVAKAPIPGQVKTRLGADVGAEQAAALASAALLDTLAACADAFDECHLALAGDLRHAVDGDALSAACAGWNVFPQTAGSLGARLAHSHRTASLGGEGPVVQVGMDTPQVTPSLLADVAARAAVGTAVLGPAWDGGWWVLALADPDGARGLADVPMSTPDTHDLTRAALVRGGLRVRRTTALRDVDTVDDAHAVAAVAPHTRFAAAWRRIREAA